jgi:hypothetical protein
MIGWGWQTPQALPLPDFRPHLRLPIYIHLRNLGCVMTNIFQHSHQVRVAKAALQK